MISHGEATILSVETSGLRHRIQTQFGAGGIIPPESVLCLSEKLPDPTNSVEINDWVATNKRPPALLGLGDHQTVEGIAMLSRQIAHPHCV